MQLKSIHMQVMNLAFCLLAGLIADDSQEMHKLASRDDFVSTLTELLDDQADADISGLIARGGECLQNAKVSRVEKALVSDAKCIRRDDIMLTVCAWGLVFPALSNFRGLAEKD